MAPPLGSTWIGNGLETLWELPHLFGIEHDFGNSFQLKTISVGMDQLPARITAQGPHKDPLGAIGVCAVAFPGAAISLGQSQFHPVGCAIDATMETPWIDKSLQQKNGMTEPRLPIAHHTAFGQR